MRVVCPACEAVYEVPDAMLGADPRPLRCARCGHEWVPAPGSAPPAPAPFPAPRAPTPLPSLAERATARDAASASEEPRNPLGRAAISRVPSAPPAPTDPMLTVFPPLIARPPRTGTRIAAFGWAATAIVLFALLAAAYVWRAELQAAWPPIQRAYAAIGLG